jgi:hypothetical protein
MPITRSLNTNPSSVNKEISLFVRTDESHLN